MALSGYIETGAYNASDGTRTIVLEWSATQSGAADNYSDVSWTLRGGGTSSQGINAKNIQAQIHTHATGLLWTTATRLYNGTVIASGKVRVNHNTDGTASFYLGISGYIYNYGANYEKTASSTPSLDTINRYFSLDIGTYIDGVQDDTGGQVTFDLYINGGLNSDNVEDWCQTLLYGTTYSIADVKAYPGYRYDGLYSGALSGTITGNAWTFLKVTTRTYTIQYDSNGGVGSIPSQTVKWKEGFMLANNVFSRNGHTFLGFHVKRSDGKWATGVSSLWATSDEIVANDYGYQIFQPNQYHGIDESWCDGRSDGVTFTFYAVWQPNTYIITFDGNGGMIDTKEVEVTYGLTYGTNYNIVVDKADCVLATIFGRTYYKAYDGMAYVAYLCNTDGYTTPLLVSTNKEAVAYYDSYDSSIIHDYDTTSDVYCGELEYNGEIYYYLSSVHQMEGDFSDSSGLNRLKISSMPLDQATEEILNNAIINTPIPIRQAYEFLGWYSSPTGGVQVYDTNGLCTNDGVYWQNNVCIYTEDYTLYAQWKVLNIAYYKHKGEWKLCRTYIKENNEWKPAMMYIKSNGTYIR